MPKVYGHDRDTAARLRNKSRREYVDAQPPRAILLPKQTGGGGAVRYFKLREDATGNGPVWAQDSNKFGDSLGGHTQVYNWFNVMTGAQVGYTGQFVLVDGTWDISMGPCATACSTVGTLTIGDPPDGTVGNEYSHSVSGSGLNSLSASGLPTGLAMDGSGNVTGIPEESGTFYVVVTGTADATPSGTCTLTRIMVITIEGEV